MARKRVRTSTKLRAAGPGTHISWLLIFAVALFLLTRGYILFVLEPQITDVESTYFAYAVQAYDANRPPYSDILRIEYPPVAWWLIYVPRLFDSRHIVSPAQIRPALQSYSDVFRGLMFLCDLGSAALLLAIVKKRSPHLLGWTALTYTATTAILGHLLYDRLDIAVLLFMLGWAFCWLRSQQPGDRVIAWSTAAYAVLGLSISFKLIPIIGVPLVVLADWRGPQRTMRLLYGFMALLLASGLPFLIQYLMSGPGVFAFLKYHGERGIQIESLYSTALMIGSLFGYPIQVVRSHAAFDLEGVLSKLMISLSNVLMFVFLVGTWLWAFFRRAAFRGDEVYRAVCFVMIGAVIFSKVLSPQYFIWALPLALLLAVDVLPQDRIPRWLLTALLVVVAALTTWLFPYHYTSHPGRPGLLPLNVSLVTNAPVEVDSAVFSALWPTACIVLAVRNLLFLAVVIWMGVMLFCRTGKRAATNG